MSLAVSLTNKACFNRFGYFFLILIFLATCREMGRVGIATMKNTTPRATRARTSSPFFVFDVESIGLHGEGFAVAGGVYLANGAVQWEFCFCCPTNKAEGLQSDRDWVSRNVPVMEITHRDTYGLRLAFWQAWEKAKADGAEMAAECLWPVEARFLQDCIRDDAQRLPTAPYPCHEIASVMLSAGMNPMVTYDRTPWEMPRHNPLADARQSARLLSEALARMGTNSSWTPPL